MNIMPYDYVTDRPSPTFGLARTAALIRTARAEVENSILLDNGDFLVGTPMGDALARASLHGTRAANRVHPIVASMKTLGFDAVTLGNHDFDHGAEYLGDVMRSAPFPVVCSNMSLERPNGGPGPAPLPFVVPFALIERYMTDKNGSACPLRIGLLGFMPPNSVTGLHHGPFRPVVRDIVRTAREMVPQLRAMGADLIVAMAHSGVAGEDHVDNMENAVVPLSRVAGIDAIVAGHNHLVFPGVAAHFPAGADPEHGTIHGTPVVSPGFWGSHLGVIDLKLRRLGNGRWRVRQAHSEARPVFRRDPQTGEIQPCVKPEPAITRMLATTHHQMKSHLRRPVGQTSRRLHSYFATIAPSTALDIVHRATAWYAARQIADTPLRELALLASTAPFKCGGLAGPGFFTDVAPGEMSMSALADLYLYPNDICVLRLSGHELRDWLDRAASAFNTIVPGRADQTLIGVDVPSYQIEYVAGVDYQIDLTAPARFNKWGKVINPGASRIRDLTLDGRPLDLDQDVLLATNSYRQFGNGQYPRVEAERVVLDLTVGIRDVIAAYLTESGRFDHSPWASWRLAAVPGARVQVVSSPRASEVLCDTGLDIMPGHTDEDGFQRFELAL